MNQLRKRNSQKRDRNDLKGCANGTKEMADGLEQSRACKSALRAFEMTNRRLFPEPYKEKVKRG
jgi:hypothetical protein